MFPATPFGASDCPEAVIFGVEGDVGFCTEGKVVWVAVDESLDIEAMI
jgi:hypothetical protein